MYLSSALQPFIYSQLLTSLPRQSSLFLISDLWCCRLDFRGDGSLISHTTTPGCMLFCIVYKNDKHPHLEYAKYHTSWPETQAIQFLNIVLACISWSSYRNIYIGSMLFSFSQHDWFFAISKYTSHLHPWLTCFENRGWWAEEVQMTRLMHACWCWDLQE
jgi:hypothetical protein